MPVQLLPRVHVGAPIQRSALTLFPMWTEHPEVKPSYVPASHSIATAISELSQPDVPHLAIENSSDVPVLMLEGELIAGGLQHRTLNVTVLLPPQQQTVVPVSCVEHGRWHRGGASTLARRHSPPSLRRRKTASVAMSVMHGRGRVSDQGGVWAEVNAHSARLGAFSPTESLLDTEAAARPTIEQLAEDLHPLPGQRGFVVGIAGKVHALELFDSADVFAHYFAQLVEGYAAEAVSFAPKATSSQAARRFIRGLQTLDVRESTAVGMGIEMTAADDHHTAIGLRVADRPSPVHLAAFAA